MNMNTIFFSRLLLFQLPQTSKAVFFLLFCFLFAVPLRSQTYQFNQYSIAEGLPQPYIYAITQSRQGFMWFGTGEGLCRFNGIQFNVFSTKQGIAENFVTAAVEDRFGTLWFGHNQGGITRSNGFTFTRLNTEGKINSTINQFYLDDLGYVWVATQRNGIFRVSTSDGELQSFGQSLRGLIVNCIVKDAEGNFFVGTNEGLRIFKMSVNTNQMAEAGQYDELEYVDIQSITADTDNNFWVGTSDRGLLKLIRQGNGTYKLQTVDPSLRNVNDVLVAKDGALWISEFGKGVRKLLLTPNRQNISSYELYNQNSGLKAPYIKKIYQDREGNIWLGSYGEGLLKLVNDIFLLYQVPATKGNVLSVGKSARSQLWAGMEEGLVRIGVGESNLLQYTLEAPNQLPGKITAVYEDPFGVVWVGSDDRGLYRYNPQTGSTTMVSLPGSQLAASITSITARDKDIWIGTKDGLFLLDPSGAVRKVFNTESGMLHNNINQVFRRKNGDLLIVSPSNFLTIISPDQQVNHIEITATSSLLNVRSITEDASGTIWMATYGDGLLRLYGEELKIYAIESGLLSNYCYSVHHDARGVIWIGHRIGLSRINLKDSTLKVYSKSEGVAFEFNPGAITTGPGGEIWFGSQNGLLRYFPDKDVVNNVPPKLNLLAVWVGDERYSSLKDIELPYDRYKIRFEFIGLSYKDPEKVTYTHKLEGFDMGWSDASNARIIDYPKVEDGNYTFLLKACNGDGVCSEEPISLRISIAVPFWKNPWIIGLFLLSLTSGIYGAVQYRIGLLQREKEKLERMVEERTQVIVTQKNEIEEKSQNIIASINYAGRIQKAILGNNERLRDIGVKDGFVFYVPKDIVSGDFYWFAERDGLKFVVVADCTGHGVPGAFMTIMGVNLLNEIIVENGIINPADVLYKLDEKVASTLQTQSATEAINDGMEIALLVLDEKRKKVHFAGARSPLFFVRGGFMDRIKGSRYPIGSNQYRTPKEFETITIDYEPGDVFYIFSDGYQDQFGGLHGRKYLKKKFRDLLLNISDLPMPEQETALREELAEWRGDTPLTDDITVGGLRMH